MYGGCVYISADAGGGQSSPRNLRYYEVSSLYAETQTPAHSIHSYPMDHLASSLRSCIYFLHLVHSVYMILLFFLLESTSTQSLRQVSICLDYNLESSCFSLAGDGITGCHTILKILRWQHLGGRCSGYLNSMPASSTEHPKAARP